MAAALVAALEGLEVLLCEASDQVGGTAATSAGTLWIPGNRQSIAAGVTDSAEAVETYLDAIIGAETSRHLRAAFLRTGPDAIDYLAARSDVVFRPCGRHPDYRSNQPGAAISGRAIIPEPCLWDPESPFVYQCVLELWQDGQLCDQRSTEYGLSNTAHVRP